MREIIFRGKALETCVADGGEIICTKGEWVYGAYVPGGNSSAYIIGNVVEAAEEYFLPEWWIPVDPATVGQYVRTINGKRVFVGDTGRDTITGEHFTMTYLEHWQRFAWTRPNTVFSLIPDARLELLGNIHDKA